MHLINPIAIFHRLFGQGKDHSIPLSATLLAEAVAARELHIARNILQGFSNDQERITALSFRNCHHGKPLGTAVERGDVKMASLILSYLSDKEAASGHQCSTMEVGYRADGPQFDNYGSVTAAVIALHKCAEKPNYPCQEMLDVLRQRDVFNILREKETPLESHS